MREEARPESVVGVKKSEKKKEEKERERIANNESLWKGPPDFQKDVRWVVLILCFAV